MSSSERLAFLTTLSALRLQLACTRFLALARAKLYWMVPAWGSAAGDLPVETQLLLAELGGGGDGFALLLPLIERDAFRGSLRPPVPGRHGAGSVLVRVESGDESVRGNSFQSAVYVAAGRDPFELVELGVAAAARMSGSSRPREEKAVPASLDCFGWCTWDAMYTDVNPAGIQAGLRALAAGGTPPRLLVIDDGWQQIQLDAEFRPGGVDSLVESMKAWSADAVGCRRRSAELVFQDPHLVEPLKFIEEQHRREESEEARRLGWVVGWARWARCAAAGLLLRAEGAAAAALKRALEVTPSDSGRLEVFAAMATGPFRRALLRFYASASSHSRRLLSVKANGKFKHLDEGADAPLASPSESFGEVVRGLKERYGVQYVVCWHAMAGYWSGCMPGVPGTAAFDPVIKYPRPSPGTLEVDPSMRWVHPAVAGVGIPRQERRLHSELHAYLAGCGVDGVKVDVQATVSMFGWDCGGYAALSSRFHRSLEASCAAHLPGNHVINSMCCSIEDLYNMPYSNIARVGEDFYPLQPASHLAHIANAAFTTLMTGAVAFPDWDMFHSSHGAAALHAAARAVSGGLVYVSDRAGDHDFGLLRRLVLPDGSVLRCRLPARPTADCLFQDVSRNGVAVLKVWNKNAVTAVVGVFNVQGATWSVKRRNYHIHDCRPRALPVEVRPADVPQLPEAQRYAMYSDATKEVRVMGAYEAWRMEVAGNGGHDLVAVCPVLTACTAGISAAPIGLVNMLNAGGAVRSCALDDTEGVHPGAVLSCAIFGCGDFLVYASSPPARVLMDGEDTPFTWDEGRGAVSWAVPEGGSMDKSVRVVF